MDCHDAGGLIMKYMDDSLGEAEAAKLGGHLKTCPACKADFDMYDSILKGFSEMELICAPEGFEECVMSKVRELPSLAGKLNSVAENMMCLIWGAVSVLFGVGMIAALNRDAIMAYLYSQPALSGYAGALAVIGRYSSALAESLALTANQLVASAGGLISASRFAVIAILAVLAAAQVILRRRAAGMSADAD